MILLAYLRPEAFEDTSWHCRECVSLGQPEGCSCSTLRAEIEPAAASIDRLLALALQGELL